MNDNECLLESLPSELLFIVLGWLDLDSIRAVACTSRGVREAVGCYLAWHADGAADKEMGRHGVLSGAALKWVLSKIEDGCGELHRIEAEESNEAESSATSSTVLPWGPALAGTFFASLELHRSKTGRSVLNSSSRDAFAALLCNVTELHLYDNIGSEFSLPYLAQQLKKVVFFDHGLLLLKFGCLEEMVLVRSDVRVRPAALDRLTIVGGPHSALAALVPVRRLDIEVNPHIPLRLAKGVDDYDEIILRVVGSNYRERMELLGNEYSRNTTPMAILPPWEDVSCPVITLNDNDDIRVRVHMFNETRAHLADFLDQFNVAQRSVIQTQPDGRRQRQRTSIWRDSSSDGARLCRWKGNASHIEYVNRYFGFSLAGFFINKTTGRFDAQYHVRWKEVNDVLSVMLEEPNVYLKGRLRWERIVGNVLPPSVLEKLARIYHPRPISIAEVAIRRAYARKADPLKEIRLLVSYQPNPRVCSALICSLKYVRRIRTLSRCRFNYESCTRQDWDAEVECTCGGNTKEPTKECIPVKWRTVYKLHKLSRAMLPSGNSRLYAVGIQRHAVMALSPLVLRSFLLDDQAVVVHPLRNWLAMIRGCSDSRVRQLFLRIVRIVVEHNNGVRATGAHWMRLRREYVHKYHYLAGQSRKTRLIGCPTLLHMSIALGDSEVTEILLRHASFDRTHRFVMSLLHTAALVGDVESFRMIKELCPLDVDVGTAAKLFRSALRSGKLEMVSTALSLNAEISWSHSDKDVITTVFEKVWMKHPDEEAVYQLLRKHGGKLPGFRVGTQRFYSRFLLPEDDCL